jgi:hypothetical protein
MGIREKIYHVDFKFFQELFHDFEFGRKVGGRIENNEEKNLCCFIYINDSVLSRHIFHFF